MRRALCSALALALAVPATAAAGEIRITSVESRGGQRVAVTVVTPTPTRRAPAIRENGGYVAGLVTQNLGEGKSVVLAIDRSRSMQGAALTNATAAARSFVASKPASDRISVVAIGTRALQLTRFSSATIDADIALRTVTLDSRQGTALNDALVLAARALEAEEAGGRVIVLLTDGNEVSSEATEAEAIAAAKNAGVSVYPVAIESARFSPAPLKRIAAATGGTYRGASSSAALGQLYAAVAAELRRTWRLEYLTSARAGTPATIKVWVPGGGTATKSFTVAGTATAGGDGSGLIPARLVESTLGSLLLAAVVAGLVLLAAAFVFAARRGSWLRGRLAPHVQTYTRAEAEKEERKRLAVAADLFRATERSFGGSRIWRRIQTRIDQADLPLQTVEVVYMCAGAAVLLGLMAAIFGMGSRLIVLAMLLGAFLPYGFVAFRARRRSKAFEDQLSDLLMSIAASLKAGHSFKQGLQSIADEGRPPASVEFQRILTDMQLGRPMDDTLSDAATRVGSKDFEFVVTAVTIQRQVGGSLANLFDMIADTVRQRQAFARKVKGLTAMGRASAYVLVGLPFVLAAVLTLLNPEYMSPLYGTPTGHKLIIVGAISMTIGSVILRKIVSFKG